MSRGIAATLRCVCGTAVAASLAAEVASCWHCPACARLWRVDLDAVRVVRAGLQELLCLQGHILVVVGLTTIVLVLLAVVHPVWLLGAPMVIGGVALIAGPSYRRRADRAKAAVRTPISLTRAAESSD
ncbi:hypothetical protein [Mycobacterium stomatepiae]|uniref:hypothetical protein n=1 Tax=Mycobacterium stomatepiae TaxID=470076 RepID=UPI0013D2FDE0|nr:hypothetical protein [Mycobacterium stomatepiae]MCV7163585.1 hypothetical protein [Mycobacterium stomatepiae]